MRIQPASDMAGLSVVRGGVWTPKESRHGSLKEDMFWLLATDDGRRMADICVRGSGGGAGDAAEGLPAHSVVLAARVPYFKERLFPAEDPPSAAAPLRKRRSSFGPGGCAEGRPSVTVPVTCSDSALKMLLCFVYCNHLGKRNLTAPEARDLLAIGVCLSFSDLVREVVAVRPTVVTLDRESIPGSEGTAAALEKLAQFSSPTAGNSADFPFRALLSTPDRADSSSTDSGPDGFAMSPKRKRQGYLHDIRRLLGDESLADVSIVTNLRRASKGRGKKHQNGDAENDFGYESFDSADAGDEGQCPQEPGREVKVFVACRVMLSARCKFFEELFSGGWACEVDAHGRRVVDLSQIATDDVDSQTVGAVLEFLHTDSLKFLKGRFTSRTYDFHEAAEYFMADHLTSRIQHFMSLRITPHTVCSLWNAANRIRAHATSSACRKFLIENYTDCFPDPDFLNLEKEQLKEVLSSGNVKTSTFCVFNSLQRWAEAHAEKLCGAAEPAEIEELLRDLLPPCTLFNLENKRAVMGLAPSRMYYLNLPAN